MHIRESRQDDFAAIHYVHNQAFDRPDEARLVAKLQASGAATVSLVAVVDGQVVGHILFSPVEIVMEGDAKPMRAAGLAPLAVLPAWQRRGIGSQLARQGLAACRDAGFDGVVVLGDPAFYGRFGFRRASEFGLGNQYGVDDEFMAIGLRSGALAGVAGVVQYLPEFSEIGA
ncbi:MAG TPA: N-acetyltransferase [Thermomicrobiales bacterium]|nr:N-acetyltransferase [Thermomicrobiales bacterium]